MTPSLLAPFPDPFKTQRITPDDSLSSRVSSFIDDSPYYLQGEDANFKLFKFNFLDSNPNTDTEIRSFDVATTGMRQHGRILSNGKGIVLIAADNACLRVQFDPNNYESIPTIQEYPVQTSTGFENYRTADVSKDGSFFVVGQVQGLPKVTEDDLFGYKFDANSLNILAKIESEFVPIGVSLKKDSPFLLFSGESTNPRRIYDHTKIPSDKVIKKVDYIASHSRLISSKETSPLIAEEFNIYISIILLNIIEKVDFNSGESSTLYTITETVPDKKIRSMVRISNSTYGVSSSKTGWVITLFNFMDTDDGYYLIESDTGDDLFQISVSQYFRLMITSDKDLKRVAIYNLDKYFPCWGTCATCDRFKPDHCITCKEGAIKSGNKCYCSEGEFDSVLGRCKTCKSPCGGCKLGSETECTSCEVMFSFKEGTCLDCSLSEVDDPSCPEPVKFILDDQLLPEGVRNFTAKIEPDIEKVIGKEESSLINFGDIFSLKFFDKKKNLEILKNFTSVELKSVNLEFKIDFNLTIENAENIKIIINFPQNKFFNSSKTETEEEKKFYFKIEEYELKLKESQINKNSTQNEDESEKKEAKEKGKKAGLAVTGIAFTGIIISILMGSSFVFILKFIQIVDLLSNLAKINVRTGPKLEHLLTFLSGIGAPELSFLKKLSPLENNKNAFKYELGGPKGKSVEENSDVFIFSGQNFIISTVLSVSLLFNFLLKPCTKKGNCLYLITTYVSRILLGFFYYDFQLISFSEISTRNLFWPQRTSLIFSFIVSYFFILVIIFDILRAWVILVDIKRGNGRKKQQVRLDEKIIFENFTEDLCDEAIKRGEMFWIQENVKFSILQILIATLQRMKQGQVVVIFIVNLLFSIKLLMNLKQRKIFKGKFTCVKIIISEICLFFTLLLMTISSFWMKNGFENRTLQIFDLIATFLICTAIFVEFLDFVKPLWNFILGKIFKVKGKDDHFVEGKVEDIKEENVEKEDQEEKENEKKKRKKKKNTEKRDIFENLDSDRRRLRRGLPVTSKVKKKFFDRENFRSKQKKDRSKIKRTEFEKENKNNQKRRRWRGKHKKVLNEDKIE